MNVPSPHRRYSLPDTCMRYATIKEEAASRDKPVCVGHDSEWKVYESVSNSVDLHLISAESISNIGAFLIYYEGACVQAVCHCGSRAVTLSSSSLASYRCRLVVCTASMV